MEFIFANKVTRIINCAGRQLQNRWENIGVIYLTFNWHDSENQILYDLQDKVTCQIYDFIDKAAEQAESVLVHSVRGQSRASAVIAAYLMRKYRWSLLKTLEFLNWRRSDLEIRESFIQQLSDYETRLLKRQIPCTKVWSDVSPDQKFLESEELLVRNTFLNSQTTQNALQVYQDSTADPSKVDSIKWKDLESNGKMKLTAEAPKMKQKSPKTLPHQNSAPKKSAIKVAVAPY